MIGEMTTNIIKPDVFRNIYYASNIFLGVLGFIFVIYQVKKNKKDTRNTFLYTIHDKYKSILQLESTVLNEIMELNNEIIQIKNKKDFINSYFSKKNLIEFLMFYEHFGGLVKNNTLDFNKMFYDLIIFPDTVWEAILPIIVYTRRNNYIYNFLENYEYLCIRYQARRVEENLKFFTNIEKKDVTEKVKIFNRLPSIRYNLVFSNNNTNYKKQLNTVKKAFVKESKINRFRARVNNYTEYPLQFRVDNLLIRDFKEADKKSIKDIVSDDGFYFYYFKNNSHNDFINRAINDSKEKARNTYRFAITKRNILFYELIGYISLCDLNSSDSYYPDIGYFIKKNKQGRKIASLAVENILNWSKSRFNINEIYATVHESNTPSLKVLEKNGFEHHDSIEKYDDDKPRLVYKTVLN